MKQLTDAERRLIEPIDQAAMLARTERWCAINSGTGNLEGLARQAGELADAFATLPGDVELRKPGPLGKWLRMLDRPAMEKRAREKLSELGLMTIQNIGQAVETLSGGQRQGVAVARAAAFGSKVIIMDEPTAALGVKESRRVLELILDVKRRGVPIVLISHNMPHVFEVADRIHIHRLGRRLCVIDPKDHSMSDAVAFMTGAKRPPEAAMAA